MRHYQARIHCASLVFLTLLFVSGLSALAEASSSHEETWVEIAGEAEVLERNEAHARDAALNRALEQAVEMVAGTIAAGLMERQEFISVRDEITSRSAGFVRRYEIKEAGCESDVCRVSIRAQVDKQALTQRLLELDLLPVEAPMGQDGEYRSIRLDVEGFGTFTEIARLHSLLPGTITGVRAVHTRSISGKSASLELETTIGAEQLAAELSTRPLGNFSVQVTRVDSTSVGIRLFGG